MKHYKYGGSSAGRTIACPSWHKLAAQVPRGGSSSYADEGTVLHKCMEMILEEGYQISELIGMEVVIKGDVHNDGTVDPDIRMVIDDDHAELLIMALMAWDELCLTYKIEDFASELTFHVTDEEGGSCDVLAWSAKHVIAVDWKFGQGIEVDAKNSKQGMFYLNAGENHTNLVADDGALLPPNDMIRSHIINKDKIVAIIQPMPSRGTETLKVWEVPDQMYVKFKRDHHNAMGGTGLTTGEHCKFCPGQSICPKKTGQAHAAKAMGEPTLDTLKENLLLAWELEDWCKKVKQVAHEQMEQGHVIDGFKLVQKRATRAWTDPSEAAFKLGEELAKVDPESIERFTQDVMTTPTLKSPAQVEKVCKKAGVDMSVLGQYIKKQSSGTTLVDDSDPREAVSVNVNGLKAALERSQ